MAAWVVLNSDMRETHLVVDRVALEVLYLDLQANYVL